MKTDYWFKRQAPWTLPTVSEREDLVSYKYRLLTVWDDWHYVPTGQLSLVEKKYPTKVLAIVEKFSGKRMPGRYRKQIRRLLRGLS